MTRPEVAVCNFARHGQKSLFAILQTHLKRKQSFTKHVHPHSERKQWVSIKISNPVRHISLAPWQTVSIKERQKDRIKVEERQEKNMFTHLNLLQYNVTINHLV
jgi:uncharacterized protein (UPF0218 family)